MADQTIINAMMRADQGLGNDRPIDMEARLHLLEPGRNANFEKILRKLGKKVPKTRTKFQSRRRELVPHMATVTVADAAAQAHIEVDDYEYIQEDVLMYNTRTNELYLQNETEASQDATVSVLSLTNSTPGTAEIVYATEVGDKIVIMPESHAEGEEIKAAYRTESTEAEDYIMQIDRRSADLTDISMAESEWDPKKQRARDNQMAMIEYMQGTNLLFYLSQSTREVLSAAGPRRHALGGLREFIVSNRISLAGVGPGLTTAAIGEILRKTMYQGAAGNKFAMVGQYGLAAMSAWPVGSTITSPREKEWGYNIKTIITPHGNLDVTYDPTLTAENGLADVMAIIDEAQVRQVYLQGMGLKLIKRVSSLSHTHRIVDAITSTVGLQKNLEELHAWVEDIS